MSFAELAEMVNRWPWFAAARAELAIRSGRAEDATLYVCTRGLLKKKDDSAKCQAPQVGIDDVIRQTPDRKIIVLGGDFFSQEQYDAVREEGDSVFSSLTAGDASQTLTQERNENVDFEDYSTETLAKVYAEQGYTEEAKYIYSKLCLRYPEKNAYFAALIRELDKTE